MNARNLLIIPCCVAVIASACMSRGKSGGNVNKSMNANEEQASDLIRAISDYEQDHGHFPAQLDTVVPTYLAEIPQTVEGQDFTYGLHDIDGYFLCFHVPRTKGCGCCYTARHEFWDCACGYPE